MSFPTEDDQPTLDQRAARRTRRATRRVEALAEADDAEATRLAVFAEADNLFDGWIVVHARAIADARSETRRVTQADRDAATVEANAAAATLATDFITGLPTRITDLLDAPGIATFLVDKGLAQADADAFAAQIIANT